VRLPAAVARALRRSGHRTKKGPVFDTAIVAGVMAAKRTSELIPFCHPLALEQCRIDIGFAPAEPAPRGRGALPGRSAAQDRRGNGSA
jgi:molybdenum cofactor biosynthesis enzyme